MAYVAPIHPPTSVRQALKLELLSEGKECLVLAKSNKLEIWSQTSDGLSLSHTRRIYGRVTFLEKLRPTGATTDYLFVGTDMYMYFTVFWDPGTKRLCTEKTYVDVAERTSRDSQTEDRCLIDPTQSFMALLLYDGIVTIVPLSQGGKRKALSGTGALGDPLPVRIEDQAVRSSTFLHSRAKDRNQVKLAFLFEDSHQKVCLSVRALDYTAGGSGDSGSGDSGSADLENKLGERNDLELGASHVIPVPAPAYGFLVIAEATISYFSDIRAEPLTEPLEEGAQFMCYTQVDSQRWLMADDYGKLYLLMLLLEDDGGVAGWKLDAIGQTSRASVLVYLDEGFLFVGSQEGDSQVIKINEQSIEVVQTISNIAPVVDFTIMDMESRAGEGQTNEYSSGQARIVTGSGAFEDGSLRSVRSGVGLDAQGVLDNMSHATELFGLRSSNTSSLDDVLVVSFVGETRVFHFAADGEIEEYAEFKSFVLSEGTILAASLSNEHLLQVTGSGARLMDSENDMVLSEWHVESTFPTGQTVTAASASSSTLALSIGGLEYVTLDLSRDLRLKARRQFAREGQIACVHVSDLCPNICMAGLWKSGAVAILSTDNLETIQMVIVSDDAVSVPRSILLTQILAGQSPTLFIAMANGEVITFSLETQPFALSSKKTTVLGTQQANFNALPRDDGLFNVFATCEHPSLIYGSEGRIVYSAITAEKATCVCSFNSDPYHGAIAIATPEDVQIAHVDTERRTHVQTLHVGETVRRIAYSPGLKAFGMGTIRRHLRNSEEITKSHFKLADEVLFKELDTFEMDEEELVESVIRAEISEDSGDLFERFIVGTTFMDDEHGDAIRGRILVFAVTAERKLRLITSLPVKGACRALGAIHGNIVAALVKTVVIYTLTSSHLRKQCTYRTSTTPIALAIHTPTSQICVADLIKSISILTYHPPSPSSPPTLLETARHFQTAWSTACAHVGENTWLESDAEGNLLVLRQDVNGVTEDDRRMLRVEGEMRLGEMVNRMQEVNVVASPGAVVTPKAFMATVEGGVYLFGLINVRYIDLLLRLQAVLAGSVVALGNVPWGRWRGVWNGVREESEPERFVDGELVEGFLDLGAKAQESVAGEVGRGVEEVRELVEGLRRLH